MAVVQHVRHNAPRPLARRADAVQRDLVPDPLLRRAGVVTGETRRPPLHIVQRRQRALHWLVAFGVVVGSIMIGSAWFQTRLAQRQKVLDQIDRQVRIEAQHHDELVEARSALLAPARLINRAAQLGMSPGVKARIMHIGAETAAYLELFAPEPSPQRPAGDPLDDGGAVKAAVGANR